MFRKILWCYVFILTILDISLNTKLTAQGKSHGVTVHDSLIEGVTFQEWGKDNNGDISGGADGGAESDADGVRLRPAALSFGRAALAAAHARTVTLTNTANTTLHLASVAGTTPDFHASFFEAKTLPPQGNTTFSVVYLGRREGPVAAHLYIQTSLGVHKYPVSAVGVASEYDVWPLVGVRVPLNATVEPELTLYNPTDHTIQVSEVYSSGAWLGLRLPGGGERAPRALWAVPPRTARALVRLRLAPPPSALHPLTAYIRIKANIPGGGLVVAVEARSAPAGEHARPLQLRLRARGSNDPPQTVELELGNSGGSAVPLEAGVRARCGPPGAPAESEPCAAAPPPDKANGGGSVAPSGARVSLLRAQLEPYEDFTKVAHLTLDYRELWAQAGGGGGAGEAWCAGCVRLGRAALPYSVRLLPGALTLHPESLHFVTAEREAALGVRELRATNQFEVPLRVDALQLPPDAAEQFHVEELMPLSLAVGETAALARITLRARAADAGVALAARATLRTNLSDYTVPLLVYSGRFSFDWEWPNATQALLELGVLGTGTTLRLRVRLRNPGPAPLCVVELGARLPPATAVWQLERDKVDDGAAVCVPGGGFARAELAVTAPEQAGIAAGTVWARSEYARSDQPVRLRAQPGLLTPRALFLPPAAPYAWSSAEVVVDNSMMSMAVLGVSLGGDRAARWAGSGTLAKGVATLGTLTYAPEYECAPRCYTGLDLDSPEGESWMRRATEVDAERALGEDLALLLERLAQFERQAARPRNVTLLVRTADVVQLEVAGTVRLRWPRLAEARAGAAGAAAVGGTAALRLLLRNPSRAPLLLHALLADRPHLPPLAGGDSMFCERARCVWARDAWSLGEWRVTRGRAARWPATARAHNGSALPALLLQPDSEVEFKITFAPTTPDPLTTYLFLRNNLTILEGVQLWGQGAMASFEVGGRRPGAASPILFEVSECGADGGAGGAGAGGAALVRRSVVVRNTGRVSVRLRDWRVAGRPCAARGFRVQPCAALQLAPNASRLLHLAYAADFTLARAQASLQLRSELGIAEFTLAATTPAKLLPRCAAGARPPWDAPVRAGAWVLALAAFAVVFVAGVVDAERSMRSLRAVRSPPRPPLDLRRAPTAPEEPPAPEPRASRRRRPARRPPPPLDPHAERRAFERWRSEMMRRGDDDDSRSSEDADADADSDDRDRSFEPPPTDDLRCECTATDYSETPRCECIETDYSETPRCECTEADYSETLRCECPVTDYSEPPRCECTVTGYSETPREEESISSGSDASSPADERDEIETEPYEAENEATTREPSPTRPDDRLFAPVIVRRETFPSSTEGSVRPTRPRRERTESLRRSERVRTEIDAAHSRVAPAPAATVSNVIRHHTRREKTSKRRTAAPPTPARASPCATVTENIIDSGGENGASGTRGLVRSGASWSSVVGGAAPLPPIGSDVRRREPADRTERTDHSLFYYNGDAPRADTDFPWAAPSAHLPHPAHPTPFAAPSHDYLAESSLSTDTFGGLGVWGGSGAWPWSAPLRPPPGFGAPRSPVRPYDPFRSLASIWAPGAADWRPAAPTAPPPVAPPSAPSPATATSQPAPDRDDK